jgi:hypothetical protein
MPQGNLSYCKIHPLHILFKGCTKYHYNHYSLNTFYPPKHIVEDKEDIVFSPTMVPTQFPSETRDNRLVEQIQPLQQHVCDSLPQDKKHNFSNKARNSPSFIFIK